MAHEQNGYDRSDKICSLEEISAALRECGKTYNIPTFFLFGSYARGEATKQSDIDVIFDAKNIHGLWKSEEARLSVCERLKKDVDWIPLDAFMDEYDLPHRQRFVQEVLRDRIVITTC